MNLKAGLPVDFKTSLCGDDQYSSLHVQVPCIDYCLLTVLIPAEFLLLISEVYFRSPCPNISTTPITAMGCRQFLPLSIVQLKSRHCQKFHCRNGVVDTF